MLCDKTSYYNCHQRAEEPKRNQMSCYEKWSLIVTIIGIAVGAAVLIVYALQLKAMKASVVASELAAKAAKLTAEAQINAERAWVFIDRGELADRIQDPVLVGVKELATRGRMSHCIFFIKNFGKTPAKMTMCASELQIGSGRDKPPNPGVYEPADGFPIVMLAPGESRAIETRRFGNFTDENISSLTAREGRQFLWLCGIIIYEDIFQASNKHETKFCFLF